MLAEEVEDSVVVVFVESSRVGLGFEEVDAGCAVCRFGELRRVAAGSGLEAVAKGR